MTEIFPESDKAIADLIMNIQKVVAEAGTQLPEVAEQMIAYEVTTSWIWFAVLCVGAVISGLVALVAYDDSKFFPALTFIACVFFAVLNMSTIIKAKTAPKVFVMDALANRATNATCRK